MDDHVITAYYVELLRQYLATMCGGPAVTSNSQPSLPNASANAPTTQEEKVFYYLQVTAEAELILDLEKSRMMFDEIYGLPKPPDGWTKLSTASFCLPEKNVNKWNLIFYLPVQRMAILKGNTTKPNFHERLAQNLFLLQCGPASMLCCPLAAFLALASTPPPTESEVRTYLHVTVCYNENMQPEILLLISGDDVCSPELPQAWWQLLMARFWIPDQNVSKSNVEFDLPVHDVVISGGIDNAHDQRTPSTKTSGNAEWTCWHVWPASCYSTYVGEYT